MILRFKRLIACGLALGLFATTVLAEPTSISGTYQLTADENWSTLPSIEVGAKIDLNGHKLTIPQFGSTAYTITDSRPRVQDDYELLEELVAPAGSFVNTGVIPNAKTRGVVTVDVHSTQEWWFGAQGAKWSDGAFHLLNNTTCTYLGYGKFNPDKVTKIPPVGNGVHTVENNGGKLYIDNVWKQTASSGSASGFGHNYPIYLFAENRAGAPATVANPVYLRSAQFYANGTTLSRNFVPARRKSDNAVGLLDLANPGVNEFYVSGNDVALTASGNATNELWKKVGELHVSVADDETVNNTAVTLSGNLKLVKEGKGSLVMGKTGQTYAGGTDVKAGTLASYPTLTKTTTMTAADSEKAKQYLGAQGSSITVRSGATFLPAGNYEYFVHPLFLDGGTVKNADISGNAPLQTENPGVDGFGTLSLTADSTVFPRADMLFSGGSNPVDLGGHELTVDGYTGSKRVFWKKNVTNGTLYLKGYNNIIFAFKASAAVTMTGVTLIDEIGLDMANAMTVSNYTAKVLWDNSFCAGSAALTVTGTFRPETRYFYGCTLADGATLDLSAQTDEWSATSASTKYGRKDVLFAEGATVTIDVGARELAKGDKVVEWTAKPANAAGLTFRIVGTNILPDEIADVRDDGIYYTADPDEIVAAVWTGKAGTIDIGTAANWECTNAMGKVDAKGQLPGAKTDVILAGALALDIPSAVNWKSLTAKDAALSDDCDWSGLAVPVSGKIELNGRKLTVSQLAGDCEITDSVTAYERLDYISGNASQYVDTKYILKANDIIDTRMYIPKNQNRTGMLLGCSSTGKNWYLSPNNGADYFRWKRGDTIVGSSTGSAFPKAYDTIVDIRTSGDTFTWENAAGDSGSLKATGASIVDCDRNCYILGENDAEGGQFCSAGRIYSFTITSGGTVVRDFVPVRRLGDQKVGLLDLRHRGSTDAANPEFYENASGTGAFTPGATTGEMIYTRSGSAAEAQPGELHVDVASGTTVNNTTVTLSGGLKLVKEGAGTFTAAKLDQTYAGGTEIAAGKAVFAQSGDPSSPWSADQALFGAKGSTITVDDGATLNVSGTKGLRFYDFVLAGGTLSNENFDNKAYTLAATDDGFGTVTLTADSTLLPHRQFVFNRGVLDLGGHTLTIDFVKTGKKSVFLVGGSTEADAQQIKDGTIRVVNNNDEYDYLEMTGGGCVYADTVTLDMVKAQLKLSAGNLRVRDYISEVESSSPDNVGNGILSVFGTFKPVTTFFYGCTLQDGATLDLSAQDEVWSTTSIGSCGRKTVTFADNATVTIVPQKSAGEIVNWEGAAPANLHTLKFKLAPDYPGRPSASALGIRIRTWLKVFFL